MGGDARTYAQNGFARCDSHGHAHGNSQHAYSTTVTRSEKPAKAGIKDRLHSAANGFRRRKKYDEIKLYQSEYVSGNQSSPKPENFRMECICAPPRAHMRPAGRTCAPWVHLGCICAPSRKYSKCAPHVRPHMRPAGCIHELQSEFS